MKKTIFLIALTAIVASCGSKDAKKSYLSELKTENGIYTTPETEVVDIEFKEGESPFFDVYMTTGEPQDRTLWFSFYTKADIKETGEIKKGAMPCRYYQVVFPHGETAKSWGHGPLVLSREDGTEHIIKFRLINQPS